MRYRWRWMAAGAALVASIAGIAWLLFADQSVSLLPFLRRDATWQAVQQRGVWRVGLDPSFPPFELLDATGAAVGYDVALAQALAETWGVHAEIVAVGFDSLPDTLKAGRIDSIMSAYPYDERLTQDFLFSTPYFDAGLRIAVPVGSTIRTLSDLTGQRVGVEWGSVGDMVGRRLQREGVEMNVSPFETPDELIAALLEDRSLDAIFIDNVSLRQAQAVGQPLAAIDAPLESIPYVIVMPRRATELRNQVETSLQLLRARGDLANLENRWFGHQANKEGAP
ncbi:ABC transporter substrate-binding protein [Caldilinea sp.]|uniref:substrate-binding periplasmic protein n=1 Tax=Caldilinea sp. TaxID=2293560 RepID=UPI002BA5560C|nr:ABC transporter substrate-binding protein [Caldilinea sp.]HRA67560.1 ABC transporter substrate-binding protein [Caldilinea sp.]